MGEEREREEEKERRRHREKQANGHCSLRGGRLIYFVSSDDVIASTRHIHTYLELTRDSTLYWVTWLEIALHEQRVSLSSYTKPCHQATNRIKRERKKIEEGEEDTLLLLFFFSSLFSTLTRAEKLERKDAWISHWDWKSETSREWNSIYTMQTVNQTASVVPFYVCSMKQFRVSHEKYCCSAAYEDWVCDIQPGSEDPLFFVKLFICLHIFLSLSFASQVTLIKWCTFSWPGAT